MRKNTIVKNTDMDEKMQEDAIDYAHKALEKFTTEKEIATYIKNKFDKNCGPTWNCICGRSFGSYVTHEKYHFIYFYIGRVAFLLFKSPDKNNNNNYYC